MKTSTLTKPTIVGCQIPGNGDIPLTDKFSLEKKDF
jgi:hypothetical protein